VTALSEGQQECKRFITEFGVRGGGWYADGLSFKDATSKYITELKADNDNLKTRLKAVGRGEAEPVDTEMTDADGPVEPTEFDKKFAALGGNDEMTEDERTTLTKRVNRILAEGERLKKKGK